jgi:hypothetical protein
MEQDERKSSEEQQPGERDEMEDLDVEKQQAEDVRGGARGRERKRARERRGL